MHFSDTHGEYLEMFTRPTKKIDQLKNKLVAKVSRRQESLQIDIVFKPSSIRLSACYVHGSTFQDRTSIPPVILAGISGRTLGEPGRVF
ncbi:hypothetical protein VFPPC_15312 [Pochonia chlamydosporia 170]|uniref:Uncharacterized protein n=1 Tax=Pochonia chlamydosporia 170 TaxID=1380566 RepID=A0A179G7G4_METCM|nr:hypothetical protein VFPPC_15312 [Pochonia chlamydosporia 170]OAQ73478.1 hypothetical protein VFPPC_15312 [Pochonia chlamydosporia 170]